MCLGDEKTLLVAFEMLLDGNSSNSNSINDIIGVELEELLWSSSLSVRSSASRGSHIQIFPDTTQVTSMNEVSQI